MTLAYESKTDYEKEKAKERNPAYDNCTRCGLEIHEQSWFTDDEGLHFCDKDCAEAHREQVFEDQRCGHEELDKTNAPMLFGKCKECGKTIMHHTYDKEKGEFEERDY